MALAFHANVQIKSNDRKRLEKLCRYTARPPIAIERMSETPDGNILYKLKNQNSDGTTHILFDPLELVEKVVALIPPPRANLLRYHGLFAPHSKMRSIIVPKVKKEKIEQSEFFEKARWAELLKRSFAVEILKCSACGGKMQVLATILDPAIAKQILASMGLPHEMPKKTPPRGPPQSEFVTPHTNNCSQVTPSNESFD